MLLAVSVVLAVFVVLYLALVAWDAWYRVKVMPRRDMFICEQHGPIAADKVLNLAIGGPDSEGGIRYCPICFHDKLSQAEKKWTTSFKQS